MRDLPNLIATIREHGADTVVHTAGLIGNRVPQSLQRRLRINLGGTRNVAEAVRSRPRWSLAYLHFESTTAAAIGRNAPVRRISRAADRWHTRVQAAKELSWKPMPPPTSLS